MRHTAPQRQHAHRTTAALAALVALAGSLGCSGPTESAPADAAVAPLSLAEPDSPAGPDTQGGPATAAGGEGAPATDAAEEGAPGVPPEGRNQPASPANATTPTTLLYRDNGDFDITVPADLPAGLKADDLREEVSRQLRAWGADGISSCEQVAAPGSAAPDGASGWSGSSLSWAWKVTTDKGRTLTVRADWIVGSDGTGGYLSVYAVS